MPGDIFTPMPDDQVGRLALIEAMRAQTDALQRMGRQFEGQEVKLEAIKDQLAEMRTSIALLQKDSPRAEITTLATRVTALEAAQERVKGERGAISAFFNSKAIPWVVAIGAGIAAWAKGVFH